MKIIEQTFTLKIDEDSFIQAVAAGMIRGPYGYGYWCEQVVVLDDMKRAKDLTDEEIARHILGGGSAFFCCYEDDGRKWREELTREKLMTGFGLYLGDGATSTRDEATGVVEFEIDAPTSDRIMQFALFGKQVYA